MKTKKSDLIVIGVSALSLAGIAAIYPRFPETVPVHWNFASVPDSWGPRWTILLMGALPLAVYLLMKLGPRFDPRKEAFLRHAAAYSVLTAVISLCFVPITWIVALASLGIPVDVGVLVRIVIGVLFVVIGNFLGKFRPNYFVGIRTPWTLTDPEVWRKTHRRGGWTFVAMGAAMLASVAVPHSALAAALVFASILGGVAYLFIYSYLEYRKSAAAKTS